MVTKQDYKQENVRQIHGETQLFGDYRFDRFLRYEQLREWLESAQENFAQLMSIETYGKSHEGRDLLLVTITDPEGGEHHEKPAHWVDASIHAVELTATVAACWLIERLLTGYRQGDPTITKALRTRTFYIVPRVNPDGAEWALADSPRYRRSSVRNWPYPDGHLWPGMHPQDVTGDGRILTMRFKDPAGSWKKNPDEPRLMVPITLDDLSDPNLERYQLLTEGLISDFDGFTAALQNPPQGLDMNRNWPKGWSTDVKGSGDHPLSEPEVDHLVRAFSARPNICAANAFHTPGGILLRPSSIHPDAKLSPQDLWAWRQLAEICEKYTGYSTHSVYEDYTWDKSDLMGGAGDDWYYEHRGVHGFTTEFWDAVKAATGKAVGGDLWYTGPKHRDAIAVLHWFDEHADRCLHKPFIEWHDFEHPQLGLVEIGGWDYLHTWRNPPSFRLFDEVKGHADFAISQALGAPQLQLNAISATQLEAAVPTVEAATQLETPAAQTPANTAIWRIDIQVSNSGWFDTTVTDLAAKRNLVKPIIYELSGENIEVLDGPKRRKGGQLAGLRSASFHPFGADLVNRAHYSFMVRAAVGTEITATINHDRAGTIRETLTL